MIKDGERLESLVYFTELKLDTVRASRVGHIEVGAGSRCAVFAVLRALGSSFLGFLDIEHGLLDSLPDARFQPAPLSP